MGKALLIYLYTMVLTGERWKAAIDISKHSLDRLRKRRECFYEGITPYDPWQPGR